MRQLICIFLTLTALLTPWSSYAGKVKPSLAAQINDIISTDGNNANIGVLIKDESSGNIIYSHNANQYFMPASNEKLFTAYAAIQYLGENFTYQTQLFADTSKIQNGTLNGNIYLHFSGDPTFTLDELNNMVQSLAAQGVHRINGNIVIDDTAFDKMPLSPGTTWDDKDYCWSAPISAIIVNNNCVTATLKPSAQAGSLASITLPNYPQSSRFINNVVTSSASTPNCTLKSTRVNDITLAIQGCLPNNAPPTEVSMAITNPRTNIEFLLVYLMGKNQITSPYHFQYQKFDFVPKLIANINSQPLSNLITIMLKDSNNTIANALFKTIGEKYANDTGTYENGSTAVHAILNQTIQLDISKNTLIDGSGASRYNYFTPEQIVRILEAYQSSSHAPVLMLALPISGTDGTLKGRMHDPITLGKVYAKTGTETAASTLSGFLETQKKHKLIFSIMVNGFVDNPKHYQDLQDRICKTLVQLA